jgi:hypothetical protein
MGGKDNNAPSDKAMTTMAGPWQPLQDPMKNLIPKINAANNKPWTYGPNVVQGLDPQTQQLLMQGIGQAGQNANSMNGNINFANSVGAGNYVNMPEMNGVGQVALQGVNNPTYQSMQKTLGLAMGGEADLEYARRISGGQQLNGNPHLDRVINSTLEDTKRSLLPSLEGRMAMSGRLGSNAEAVGQGEIARSLGNISDSMRSADYNQERGYQHAAGMALPSMTGQVVGMQNAAQNNINSDAYSRIGMQLSAAQQMGNMRNANINTALQGGGAAGNMANNQMGLTQAGVGLGQIDQVNRQNTAEEAQARHQYEQGGEYERINRLLAQYGAINGNTNPSIAGQAYSQSQSGPSSGQQVFGNILAAAGTGAKVASAF